MVERRQQVAVFGSWRTPRAQLVNEHSQGATKHWTHRLSNDAFEEACRAVGYRLAGHNIDLLTASDSMRTADYHVVEGFLERWNSVGQCSASVQVIRSAAKRSSQSSDDCMLVYESQMGRCPELFADPIQLGGISDWEDVHDFMIERTDTVVVIGGGDSSYRVAVRALAGGRPVVPIGTFGGAGHELLTMLENVRDDSSFPKYEYRRALSSDQWGDSQIRVSMYALGLERDPSQRHLIFLNYRRSDSSLAAGAINLALSQEFSDDDIFIDTSSIDIGTRFEDVILSSLDQTAVFVAIIGPRWLSIQDAETGYRRLDAERDFVRREIEVALRDGIPIIPVCVEGASMPTKRALPVSIADLADIQAATISSDRFRRDLQHLRNRITQSLTGRSKYR